MAKEKCADCRFSHIRYDVESKNFEAMECRIKPPKASRMMGTAYWPAVDPNEGWCGKFDPNCFKEESR